MKDRIDAKTRMACLFASPARHSMSPAIYNAAFTKLGLNLCYLAFDVGADTIRDAIASVRTLDMVGANFSMPNKTEALACMDKLSPAAELVGAVNTVVNRDGVLEGHNTDGVGFLENLRQFGFEIKGQKMTLAGVGGAGASIAIQAALDGAREIILFNKMDVFWAAGEGIAERIAAHTTCPVRLLDVDDRDALGEETLSSGIFVNATNVGMKGKLEGMSVIDDPAMLHEDLVVADCIYHPAQTKLLALAKEAGCRTINGDGMLLYQAAANFKLFTGLDMPVEYVKQALSE